MDESSDLSQGRLRDFDGDDDNDDNTCFLLTSEKHKNRSIVCGDDVSLLCKNNSSLYFRSGRFATLSNLSSLTGKCNSFNLSMYVLHTTDVSFARSQLQIWTTDVRSLFC